MTHSFPSRRSSDLRGEAFNQLMRPPFFPVRTADLLGDIHFHDVWSTELEIDGAKVTVRPVPHCGLTNGYHVELGGATVAYVSDHQMPADFSNAISAAGPALRTEDRDVWEA